MERNYAAFISYRHLPLDTAVAERLHRLIERYRVPRDLRKDGHKHLGLVFRDRDELPLSSDLTQDIYDALDHSEYLIVICTPDTPKSLWVQREIQHFLQTHDRNRVLTVLASGTVAESVPECITSVYGKDGVTVIDRIEPLCAFLVDENRQKVLRNLKSEFLRLAAAIIGCPYDSLKQRQKRYRVQQAMLAFGALAVVALAIIVLLVRWNLEVTAKNQEITAKNEEITTKNQEISDLNAQIQDQLMHTQVNESRALTLLGQSQLDAGDRIGAIESALSALEGDRPYYAPAEAVLAEALFVYQPPEFRNILALDLPGHTPNIGYSPCGRYAILDNVDYMILLDLTTGSEVWRVNSPSPYLEKSLVIDPELEYFVLLDPDGGYLCSFETGEALYAFTDHYRFMEPIAVTKDVRKVAIHLWKEDTVVIFDTEAAKEVLRFVPDTKASCGDFSADGRYLFLMSTMETENNLSVVDCRTGNIRTYTISGAISDYVLLPDGNLALMTTNAEESDILTHFFHVDIEQETIRELTVGVIADLEPEQFLMNEQFLYCVFENHVVIFSLSDGSHLKTVELSGPHVDTDEDTTYLDPYGRLITVRQNGIYTVEMGYLQRWTCNRIYESNTEISHSYSDGDWISVAFSELSTIRFLRVCGDVNGVPVEEPDPVYTLFASFEDGMLELSRYGHFEPYTVSCPYDIKESYFIHRTFSERYETADSFGLSELYAGTNQVAILCYYESMYADRDTDDVPAYIIYSAEYDRWNWFEDEVLGENSIGIFFMNEDAGFAIVGGTNRFALYDFASNSVTLDLQLPLTFLSGVRFSRDDRYALAFDNKNYQSVLIDLTSGEIFAEFAFTPSVLDNDFDLVVTEDRIFIEEVSSDDIHDYGVIIDRASKEIIAKISDIEYYDPVTNRIVCENPLISYPVYSTAELIAMGSESMGRAH